MGEEPRTCNKPGEQDVKGWRNIGYVTQGCNHIHGYKLIRVELTFKKTCKDYSKSFQVRRNRFPSPLEGGIFLLLYDSQDSRSILLLQLSNMGSSFLFVWFYVQSVISTWSYALNLLCSHDLVKLEYSIDSQTFTSPEFPMLLEQSPTGTCDVSGSPRANKVHYMSEPKAKYWWKAGTGEPRTREVRRDGQANQEEGRQPVMEHSYSPWKSVRGHTLRTIGVKK